ncbi:low affinity iron permease family protein [Sphingomonas sp. BN140010]|uniref:Low affinity iron permease family protein n=1 Tax=Sphingomonas arvum TaxID=2992113 RepID=A0ABT3JG41_9SPHN|nr:low affinity iron permease family protein [Sphingomonas sp. BN140010]MCW3798053.1 low affinity iron permease family protein [Sphingomonas sp. BN140010]
MTIGDAISDWTSKLFAHPYMQVGVIVFCVLWFAFGWHADTLTAALSVVAITLTQMVLNGQYEREGEAHRRDIAMHAKLDELIKATKRARDEMVGIEELEEEQIAELKEEAKEAIDAQGDRAGDPQERETAKAAVEQAAAKRRSRVKSRA